MYTPSIRAIIVNRSDLANPGLVAHLPALVAACNARASSVATSIVLVELPKGSEDAICAVTQMRRVSAMAFNVCVFERRKWKQL